MNYRAIGCGAIIVATLSGCYTEYGANNTADDPSIPVTHEFDGNAIQSLPGTRPISQEDLNRFQETFRCQLPLEYQQFLMVSNGGVPTKDCMRFDEAGRTTFADVLCFHAIGDPASHNSVDWHLATFEERIPKGTLPIARDSWGNLWLLAFSKESMGKIYFWDHGSYDTFDETDLKQWPNVAASFNEFTRKLQTYQAPSVAEKLPSRYEMVRQANGSLNPGASDLLNYAWHGARRNGEFVMEYVEYKVHAVFTHTDGYTDLRAQNGLIPEGETRLPR